MQKRAFCVCLFYFFHDTSNFNILNVFQCLLGWIKLAPKFKDFPAPTANFKDSQGRTFKVHARPVTFLLYATCQFTRLMKFRDLDKIFVSFS